MNQHHGPWAEPTSDVRTTDTHCPYCALQCGMTLLAGDEGRLSVTARDFPTNRGGLCRKGWTAAALLDSPERLLTPLVRDRKGGTLREAGWNEALDLVASRLAAIKREHGADAIAVFGGGGLTNEKAYLLGKFARVAVGTANIDYNGRFCMSSAATAGLKAFGIDRGLPFPIADIAGCEAILLAGSNPAETMPPLMQYFDEQRSRGGRLIVVDPRRTATAKAATLHLQTTPGSDGALATGLLHVAIRDNLIDRDFVAERTSGFEAVRRIAALHWPDRVERITGVPERQIVEAAHIMGDAATAMVLSGRGAEQQSQGVNNVLAFINLVLALGQAGKPFSGYGCFTGQGNGQGGREHGQKADQLPGYRKIADPRHRAEVAAVWGVDPDSLPQQGLSACEIFDAAASGGSVRGMMILASNVVVSGPDAGRLRRNLDDLEFLVVADPFLSETAAPRRCRAADRSMGRGGRHDDESRGARHPPDPSHGAARRRADRRRRPARDRGAARQQRDLRRRCRSRLRRTASREFGRRGRLRRYLLRADRGRGRRLLAMPERTPSGNAAPFPRPLRDRGRSGSLPCRRASTVGGGAGSRLSVLADHRPGVVALPIGCANAACA